MSILSRANDLVDYQAWCRGTFRESEGVDLLCSFLKIEK